MKSPFRRAVAFSVFLTLACRGQPPAAEPTADEVRVSVVPKKGLKYDPKALFRDDQSVLQGIFGTAGDDSINDLVLLPSRQILAVGKAGDPDRLPAGIPRAALKATGPGGHGFAALFSPDLRTLEKILFLPADVAEVQSVRIDADGSVYLGGITSTPQGCFVLKLNAQLGQLLWRINLPGQSITSLVVMPDHTLVVAPGGPFVARIKADGSGFMPWGKDERFRLDRANPQIQQKYWVDIGYQSQGFRDQGFLHGGLSDLGLTADGNLVVMACNSIRIPSGGPDFDAMLVKFSTAGDVLWAKNLAQGIPNEPDNKYPRLYVDPHSGDLIVSLTQHGHFAEGHNLAVTPGCYLTTNGWFTGDIFIGWIGRVDSATGQIKAATMYFPDTRKAADAGKTFAGSLFPEVVRTDRAGRIYVAGVSAYKLATTRHAFQSEPLGGSGFLTVFDPLLTKVLYSGLITAQGFGTRPKHLLITEAGPVIATEVTPPKTPPGQLVTANTDKTNFLQPRAAGALDAMLTLLPSQTWFEDAAE